MKVHLHTTILITEKKDKITGHGLHLNGWGRYVLGNKLACTITNLLRPNEVIPVSLEWKVSFDRTYN
jgi:hypothetical protein